MQCTGEYSDNKEKHHGSKMLSHEDILGCFMGQEYNFYFMQIWCRIYLFNLTCDITYQAV